MTLQKLLALSCLLLPMIAGAHSFETNQRVPPVGDRRSRRTDSR